MDNKMVFVVPASSDITSPEQLKGKKVALQSGSTAQEILEGSEYAADMEIVALAQMLRLSSSLTLNG